MARKAAWEDASDLGPYGKSRGTSWGRVFVLVLLVGMATFVAAYYLPLYRAQQKLSEQYRDVSQKSQSLSDAVTKAQAELKSVTEQRDQLQAEHDKRESTKKTETDQLERLRADISAKLDKLVKKGNALVTGTGSLIVALDAAVLFTPQKLELSAPGRALLCDVAKSAGSQSLHVSGWMAADAPVPLPLVSSYGNPWALSSARAAAVAQSLEEKCSFAAAQITATGNGKHDPFQAQLTNLKAAERIAIEIRSH